jgi:hypothetical protein
LLFEIEECVYVFNDEYGSVNTHEPSCIDVQVAAKNISNSGNSLSYLDLLYDSFNIPEPSHIEVEELVTPTKNNDGLCVSYSPIEDVQIITKQIT